MLDVAEVDLDKSINISSVSNVNSVSEMCVLILWVFIYNNYVELCCIVHSVGCTEKHDSAEGHALL